MNKFFKYMGCALLAALTFSACSPDEFSGADPNGLPTIGDRVITVETDQETNTAVFSLSGDFKGCYPIWYLDGKMYSILPKTSYSNMEAGTHQLEVRIMNRNGQSQGSLTDNFTFNETKVDYTQYFNKLCEKDWRIDYTEAGHMGCGEPGTDGSNWWSAGPNDKADWGVYDDRIKFAHASSDPVAGGSYSYDPGEGGTVYVNTGCSVFSEFNTNDGQDFVATVEPMTSTFELIPGKFGEEDCLYIKFPAGTLLPYVPNDQAYNEPYYRVEAMTNTRLVLVQDIGTIAWRLVFTSREDTGMPDEPDTPDAIFDWNYDASSNLWKAVDAGTAFIDVTPWFADGGWSQIGDPVWSHSGDTWELTIPEGMGGDQWQGQFPINTTLTATMDKTYNFYCLVEADNDCPGVTIKLVETDEKELEIKHDGNFFVADRHKISADKQFVYKAEGVHLSQNDAHALSLFFDFGGTPAGTHIKISKIYFEEDNSVSYDSADNLWKAVDAGSAFISVTPWFADGGWSQIGDPVWNHSGADWTLTIPEGMGSNQWQGQFPINTTLTALMSDEYDFSVTILADNDCNGVTIKLTETDEKDKDPEVKHDNNFFFADQHNIKADQPYTYKVKGKKLPMNDAHALSLFFDFGGSPIGTNIKISNIIFSKSK